MTPETGEAYYAFTFADLQAGNVAFLAGDGLASGNGERIAFKVQAVDDDGNLSDSDDAAPGDQAADGSVGVDRAAVAATAGADRRINEDGVLSPDEATLTAWKQEATTHGGTLHVVVRLGNKQDGDVLSLATGYDANKFTPVWDVKKGELSLEIADGATEADIRTALGTLSLATEPSGSASVRRVWVFPTLSGVDGFDYRVDETAGLVRYYLYDSTDRTFSAASTAASATSLFGKSGYLGVYTSDAEKAVYLALADPNTIHLAISDSVEEGKWLIKAGPREGLLFWDEASEKYGPGASGSGWNAQGDFWFYASSSWKQPDGGTGENYASIDTSQAGPEPEDISDGSRSSVSHHDLWLADGEVFMRPVDVGESPPNPILKVDFSKLRADVRQLVVLAEKHISVYDPDTPNASDISFRVSGLTGGTLQSSTSGSWKNIALTPGTQYREFTLADLKAGQVAFLAGDGLASGNGEKIVFRIQAVDKDNNFSDSDPSTGNVADPVDGEISIALSTEVMAGAPELLNADESLTPDVATLRAWKESATKYTVALQVIVKLSGHQGDDALSLATGYDASKVTPVWDATKRELSLEIASGATEADIQAALKLVEFDTKIAASASTRKVWVFPTLKDIDNLAYRLDDTAGLVRYYLFDDAVRSFPDASSLASRTSLFGRQGYLGAFTSDTERGIYKDLLPTEGTWVRLALTDAETEGKWLITAGPRKGLVFWDHRANPKVYGPGAAGSGWRVQTDFWERGQPDSDRASNDYAMMHRDKVSDYDDDSSTKSMIHYDLQLWEGAIFARLVEVAESPPNPILTADFSEVRARAERPLILTEDHISVKDIDTLDPLDDTKVDASKIKLRITNIAHGTLRSRPSDASDVWTKIVADGSNAYLEFTLDQLQGSLVALFPDAGASTLTFDIQAADDGLPGTPGSSPHLSDSDRSTSDPDPESVSVSVAPLKTVAAGKQAPINGDGALTPDDNTLDAWLAADDSLQIFVVLQEGKRGIAGPSSGAVQERLSVDTHGVPSNKIAVSWDGERLSLQGSTSAARADFQAVLNALQLQTVHFGQVSHRTISVRPELAGDVFKKDFYVLYVEVSASLPNPILEVDFGKLRVDSEQRLVLTEEHISVYDPDTTDASSVWLRVSGLTGGELQRLSSGSADDWTKIVAVPPKAYLEFTLAELRAGRIAILVGDGLASGGGTKVVFQVQAADEGLPATANSPSHLSDSKPGTSDPDPVDAEILIVSAIRAASGESVPINADELLTPDAATLTAWKQTASTHSGTLHVIVKLWGYRDGDVLSLATGYDASKIRPLQFQLDGSTGSLPLEVLRGASASDIQTALGLVELKTAFASSDSARRVWIFPTLSEVSGFRYRVDESAGLVRYYFYDTTNRLFADATTEAAARSLFGKSGYLGVFTSNAEKTIYKALWKAGMHVAITDVTTEGKWVITAGPRQGQVFWDHTLNPKAFGPGAEGSGWSTRTSFWYDKEPDNWKGRGGRNPDGEDYAIIHRSNRLVQDVFDGSRDSISHHDFLVSEQEIPARKITVRRAPPNPMLDVSLDDLQTTAQRPLILTEDHISVVDVDTRDPLDATKVDASRIKLRVSDVVGGTLQKRISASADWVEMTEEALNGSPLGYYAFTLADLQGGLIAFFAKADASTLTFKVQAADDGMPGDPTSSPNLSDSDPDTDGTQPAPVSIRVVALKEVEAGQEDALNDDGGLTPDPDTLQAWLDADGTLEIFVELQKGKSGIVVPEEGEVEEFLSLSGSVSNITATWDETKDRLSLQGSLLATVGNFEAALGALQLQTVRFKDDSTRTISVRPNVAGDVPKKDFHVREVKVGASPREPLLGVRGFSKRLATAERYLALSESDMLVNDMDTRDSLDPTKVDASGITFRVSDVVGGTLQKRISASADWAPMSEVSIGGVSQGYYAFTLADLQDGLISFFPDAGASTLTFKVQAVDDQDNFSDSDRNDNQNDADPASVSIPIVALKEIEAGQQGALNDDRPRGGLTPDPVTLQAWLDADGTLEIFVKLQKGKSGIVVLDEGVVEEVLSLSGSVSNIRVTWDGTNDRLSLQGNDFSTVFDFEEALAALQLQTVRFKDDSYRTISVSPNVAGDVPKKDFHVREVKVGASPKEPLLSVHGFTKILATAERYLVLSESHILVDDVDTVLGDGNVDASNITLRITELLGGTLQKRISALADWAPMSEVSIGGISQGYYAFTLADLQGDLVSVKASAGVSSLTFKVQAVDNENNFSDSDADRTVSIPVVALKEVEAGQKVALNDDRPRGGLTPDPDTLQAWLDADADGALEIFVELQGAKSGIVVLEEGVVEEALSLSGSVSNITATWDGTNDRLSLAGTANATRADFEAALAALQLQTVRFKEDSYRTISVRPNIDVDVPKKDFYVREVKVEESPKEPLLIVRVDKVRPDPGQYLVLEEKYILLDDADTRDPLDDAQVDASKITFRITGLTGATLQSRSSDSENDWAEIKLTLGTRYREFTLADLKSGKIAFLVGDGLASGDGKKIVFQIQAADDDVPGVSPLHLSDSDPDDNQNDADPSDVEILIRSGAKIVAGPVALLNADGVLTPDEAVLLAWERSAEEHGSTLRVIVKLSNKQFGDALSLRTGYDITKIRPRWDESTGELSLEIASNATAKEVQTALELLEFDSRSSSSASTRKVWVFPAFSDVNILRYRLDAASELVRYYLPDETSRWFWSAVTAASARSLFGRTGYLGVPLSNEGKRIYESRAASYGNIHMAISDATSEGKWLIKAGPREGQLFWDASGSFGPGATGSGWTKRTDFWHARTSSSSAREDYGIMGKPSRWYSLSTYQQGDGQRKSITHHDLLLSNWEFFMRPVEVAESPPNPFLEVDFSKFQATRQRPLILTEDHISVDDADTRDSVDGKKMDASKLKLRITEIFGGTLRSRLASDPDTWDPIRLSGTAGNQYREFTLAQLQSGLVAFFPNAGVSTLTFKIQAADDGLPGVSNSPPHLSDSDLSSPDDADPVNVSVPLVALKEIEPGRKSAINDDRPRRGLTPDPDTLQAWLDADSTLRIFVILQGGKNGIAMPSAGVVPERLSVGSSHGVANGKIAVSWEPDNWRLSLAGTANATRADFEAVLGALQLQTVHFGQVSHRTISVRPDIAGDVRKKEFYIREVQVGASAPSPLLEVDFDKSRMDSGRRFVLTEKHIFAYDPDTQDVDGNVDASRITLRVKGLTGATLQKLLPSGSWDAIPPTGTGTQYREFTLADLRAGKIALLVGDGVAKADGGDGKKIVFRIQAADDGVPGVSPPHLSDSDPSTPGDADPIDAEILVVTDVKATAGHRKLLNADGLLSPDEATLGSWKESATTHRGALYVIVRLLDKQPGDVLSLRTGYDITRTIPRWDESKGELSLEIAGNATPKEMQTALEFLEFKSETSASASTRKVWVFPILSGVGHLRYRVDEAAGLVRYYFYDGTSRSFSAASTAASERIFFGKSGYLGVHTSNAERDIYKALRRSYIHLAISDTAEEGKWVITSGPRKGQVLWNHAANPQVYGPGASGSPWRSRGEFWHGGEPDNAGSDGQDYAQMRSDGLGEDVDDGLRPSIGHHDLWLSLGWIFGRLVKVAQSPQKPVLEADFSKTRVDSGDFLVLTEDHILVDDVDTRDPADSAQVDPENITLRVTIASGGTLQERASASDPWVPMTKALVNLLSQDYYAFTLADLRAGKIAFLAGDGRQGSDGKKIIFRIQAVDNGGNLSDSDPDDDDADPMDAEILVVPNVGAIAGYRRSLNTDGLLSPDEATLEIWKHTATKRNAALHVAVRILDKQTGDLLSLQSGYDISKVTPRWDDTKGQLSIEFDGSATISDIKTTLEFLEFDTKVAASASTRKVWVFPVIPGFRYNVDESAGLVRYYLHDRASRSFRDASTEASRRIFFDKFGYLGVHTSDAEKAIYTALRKQQNVLQDMHVAITDSVTEGKWLITAGPREGELFWDDGAQRFGSVASDWSTRGRFWYRVGNSGWDYARVRWDGLVMHAAHAYRASVSHHDLWLSAGEIFARVVKVAESSSSPVLRVDFGKRQTTSQRPFILTEDYISVDDVDTRDSSDDTKVDETKITFRVMGMVGGTLQRRVDAASAWEVIVPKGTVGSAYREFTLTQLRDGLVSLLPDAGVSRLTFRIQARDDVPHLSDSDPYDDEDDADPTSVSMRVVVRKEIYAGKEMPVSDDRRATGGNGDLTPSDATLHDWIGAATSGQLRVLVKLEGGKRGDALFVEDGHGITSIASSWSWDTDAGIGVLSLQGDGSATVDDFRTLLNALVLRTVRSAGASVRTISVRPDTASFRPDIVAEVPQKDYYTRDVLVRESGPRPYVGVQKLLYLKFGQDDRGTLSPSEFLVEDFDSSASDVTIVMRALTPEATLQKRDVFGVYRNIAPESDGSLEFTLEEFRQGLIAFHLLAPLGKRIAFTLEAKDSDGNWNDIGKSNTYRKGVRSSSFHVLAPLSSEYLEVNLQTGYQRAFSLDSVEPVIEQVRARTTQDGVVHIVLENAILGDRLVMRRSVSGITGDWTDRGHRYTLTVSDGSTGHAEIAQALAEIYYRARETVTQEERKLVVRWVDGTNTETILFITRLANRPPVLRNWGMAARYHDITPATFETETPLDLGYHPYREYMPDILDNEGEVVRLEIILTDKAGGDLSADERVFLPQELRDQAKARGFTFRSYLSSDGKARALVIEVAEGKTPVSPEFMSRVLQGLSYHHGAAGRDGDVGERRRISVAVFDGEAYSQTLTMEVRLVDTSPNPARYVNTFIGTAKQVAEWAFLQAREIRTMKPA